MKTLSDILVGGLKPSEKYKFANWDDDIPNIWDTKCSSHHQPAYSDIIPGDIFSMFFARRLGFPAVVFAESSGLKCENAIL